MKYQRQKHFNAFSISFDIGTTERFLRKIDPLSSTKVISFRIEFPLNGDFDIYMQSTTVTANIPSTILSSVRAVFVEMENCKIADYGVHFAVCDIIDCTFAQ